LHWLLQLNAVHNEVIMVHFRQSIRRKSYEIQNEDRTLLADIKKAIIRCSKDLAL